MATTIRDLNAVKGTVLDLPGLMSLSADDCNVLVVSTRTLSIIQAYGRAEVGFLSRYAELFLPGERYEVAETSGDFDDINNIVNAYGLETLDMSCDVVLALNNIANVLGASRFDCGCEIGQSVDTDAPTEGGDPPGPVGEIVYGEPDIIPDRKCNAANSIHFTLVDLFSELDSHNVDDLGTLGLVVVAGLVSAIIGSVALGPFGTLIGAVVGITSVLAARIIGLSVDLASMVTVLGDNQVNLVCGLYNTTDAASARTAYIGVLTSEGTLSSAEIGIIELLLTNAVLNVLYFSAEDSEEFLGTYVGPVDCVSCSGSLPIIWSFEDGFEQWTFVDDSAPPATAERSYDAITEAIDNHLVGDIVVAAGKNISPILAVLIAAGNKARMDYSAPSDGKDSGKTLWAYYTDDTDHFVSVTDSIAGTLTLALTSGKVLERLEIFLTRGNGEPDRRNYDLNVQLEEARIETV